jgi:hypothetical protein
MGRSRFRLKTMYAFVDAFEDGFQHEKIEAFKIIAEFIQLTSTPMTMKI